jgi:hypothetical protein
MNCKSCKFGTSCKIHNKFGAPREQIPVVDVVRAYAIKNGLSTVDKKGKNLTKLDIHKKIKYKFDSERRQLESSTGLKYEKWSPEEYNNIKIYEHKPIFSVASLLDSLPKVSSSEKKSKPKVNKAWLIRPHFEEKDIKKGRFPAGSKVRRHEKVNKQDLDDLADMFSAARAGEDPLIGGINRLNLFGKKTYFG